MTVRSLVVVLSAVLGLAAVLGSAAPVHAAGSIYVGTPSVDPAPNPIVEAGKPVQFLATGSFKPPDEDAQPWIQFVWNFGDGTSVVRPTYFGAGAHTDQIAHTFADGGLYTVSVTGGHGFDFFGFRFQRTKTIKVSVACPESNPGPKKCPKGSFTPFAGVWIPAFLSAFPDADLDLHYLGDDVIGTLSYDGKRNKTVDLAIKGKAKFGRENDTDVLIVKFKATHSVEMPEGQEGKTKGRLIMPIADDLEVAYRAVRVELEDAPALLPTVGPSNISGLFTLVERIDDTTATLCSTIAAGKRKVKPDGEVVFAVQVASGGPASIPATRAAIDINVEGGTIVQEPMLLERARFRDPGFAPTSLPLNLAALGGGKGQKNAGAEAVFVVRPNPGAKQVSVTSSVFDQFPDLDQPFVVAPGPVRKLCIPVLE